MKIYDWKAAPNPRRVRIFLAEKGIQVPYQQVDLPKRENLTPEFLKINPIGRVPVLELDDGTHLAETVAICRYFEELKPEPPLMGVNHRDRALVEMWQRRMELYVLMEVALAYRNTSEFFSTRIPQVPAYGAVCRNSLIEQRLPWLDRELAGRPFVAGERYTIADITLLCAIDFAERIDVRIAPLQKHLARWHAAASSRPSAQA
jgi:glutathione S-transferase